MPFRVPFQVVMFSAFLAASAIGADPSESTLDYLRIKYTRDAQQRIVSVELPNSARDYHLEAILDDPRLVATIREIKAPGCRASFARFKELENLPSLTAVNLDGTKDANDYVAGLRGVRNLKKLSLAGSSLTNHGLYDVCTGIPSLVELDLTGSKIDSMGLLPLAKLEHLETLRLGRVLQGMSPPGSTPEEQAEDRRGFRYIANLPRLKRVDVEGIEVTTEDLLMLACNCNLQELHFGDPLDLKTDVETKIYLQECQPTLRLGPHIAKGLIGFYQATENSDGWIQSIRSCTQPQLLKIPKPQLVYLEELTVTETTNLAFLNWLPRLKRLTLRRPALGPKELAGIRDAPTVESLSISFAKIDSKMVEALATVPRLSFSRCDIDDAARALLEADTRRGRATISP